VAAADKVHSGLACDSIRAISKREHRSAPVNLNELIREVLTLLEAELQGHHIEVQTTLDERIPAVLSDRIQFQQVILNLIKNAIEAMSFVVEHSRILHLKTEVGSSQNLMIIVEDSGTGIDPKNIEKIFDRAFTTKTHGMGMGLAICRSIIEGHNGRLWAEPSFGFHCRLDDPCDVRLWHKADFSRPSIDVRFE
jgi:signal transduction histidine kinase